MNWFFIIPMWYALLMQGKESPIQKGSFFNYTITKGGRYVCSANSINYFSFDTLEKVNFGVVAESLPADSFITSVITNTVTPR